MTGVMINTVPRRVVLNPEATLLETLQQIQSDQLEISKHEDISLTELQCAGIPVSNLFNTILNIKNQRFARIMHHNESAATDGVFSDLRKEGHGR